MAAPEIGSLNAGTSGAVALFETRRQRLGNWEKRVKGKKDRKVNK
jgi:hypothetical protein